MVLETNESTTNLSQLLPILELTVLGVRDNGTEFNMDKLKKVVSERYLWSQIVKEYKKVVQIALG